MTRHLEKPALLLRFLVWIWYVGLVYCWLACSCWLYVIYISICCTQVSNAYSKVYSHREEALNAMLAHLIHNDLKEHDKVAVLRATILLLRKALADKVHSVRSKAVIVYSVRL